VSRTIRQVEVLSLDRSHCLRTCFWYSSGSTRLLLRMPAAAFQLLGIRGRGCQTPCPFRISTGVVVPIDFSFPQTAKARGPATASSSSAPRPSASGQSPNPSILCGLCALCGESPSRGPPVPPSPTQRCFGCGYAALCLCGEFSSACTMAVCLSHCQVSQRCYSTLDRRKVAPHHGRALRDGWILLRCA